MEDFSEFSIHNHWVNGTIVWVRVEVYPDEKETILLIKMTRNLSRQFVILVMHCRRKRHSMPKQISNCKMLSG